MFCERKCNSAFTHIVENVLTCMFFSFISFIQRKDYSAALPRPDCPLRGVPRHAEIFPNLLKTF